MGMTKIPLEQIEEFRYAMEGPAYWMEFFMEGTPYDEGALDLIHRNRFTACRIDELTGPFYVLWEACFNSFQRVAILAPTQKRASNILGWLTGYLKTLPAHLQMDIVQSNKHRIEFSNGSIIDAHAPYYSCMCGTSYSTIYFDNFAQVPFVVAEDFFNSIYPTVSCGRTKVIINHGKSYFDTISESADFVKVR